MNNIKIDFINKTLIVTKAFYNEACKFGTEEYDELTTIESKHPDFRIAFRSVRTGKRVPNENKGLTFDFMRRYIKIMDKNNVSTFDSVVAYYKLDLGFTGTRLYIHVKTWFLENYPEYEDMIASAAPRKVTKAAAA
ncbi:MAG: hypothetical protein J6J16_03750 [Lachnospiraceae bacterium]|nr:hypothetical protein [Lachnospiraceae bacterium]